MVGEKEGKIGRTVPYYACGSVYVIVCICQNSEMYTKGTNFSFVNKK